MKIYFLFKILIFAEFEKSFNLKKLFFFYTNPLQCNLKNLNNLLFKLLSIISYLLNLSPISVKVIVKK